MKRFIIAAVLAAAVSISLSFPAHADPDCPSPSVLLKAAASARAGEYARRYAENNVKALGLSGEKAAVARRLLAQAFLAQWKNRRFLTEYQAACRQGTGTDFSSSWLEWHTGRNLWRLSYEDQRTWYLFRQKKLAHAPSAKVCADYAYGQVDSAEDLQELMRRTWRAMSAAELDAVFSVLVRAAALEDTDEAPSLDFTEDQEKAALAWGNRLAANIDRAYPEETAERLKNNLFGGVPGDDRTRCVASKESVRAGLQLWGQASRDYVQMMANVFSSKVFWQGYPGLPESGR